MTAMLVVPPPMSITMLPTGVSTGRPTPIAAAIGSATMSRRLTPADRAESRTARRSTSVIPEGTQTMTVGFTLKMRPVDHQPEEVPEHLLRHLEVRDDAVLHRADRQNAFGRAAQHALGLESDPHDVPGRLIHRRHRGLVQHHALRP